MRALRIPADEQFRLIMECRASGLTDHEWCMQNGIRPGTFYNWVKRLRKNGCTDIPKSAGGHAHGRQEVVRIELAPPEPNGQNPVMSYPPQQILRCSFPFPELFFRFLTELI